MSLERPEFGPAAEVNDQVALLDPRLDQSFCSFRLPCMLPLNVQTSASRALQRVGCMPLSGRVVLKARKVRGLPSVEQHEEAIAGTEPHDGLRSGRARNSAHDARPDNRGASEPINSGLLKLPSDHDVVRDE